MFKSTKTKLLVSLIKTLGHLPYMTLPILGWCLGWSIYIFSPKTAQLMREQLCASKLYSSNAEFQKILHANIQSNGVGLLETLHLWFKPYQVSLNLVRQCSGWDTVKAAVMGGKGIIFLTPHLGCFEITSLYFGQFYPLTVMFRPPRQSWLMPLITAGRQRGNVTLAPANSHGIKQLLQALKRGEAIGILPDQAPLAGEGEWAPFFGRPADTMTLASKLANKTGATVFMAFGERLSRARGYHIHIKELKVNAISTPTLLNSEIENQIKQCPAQYLWSYTRYKSRRGPPQI
ncbi:MAG: lysophospholipid acyltransferase family protein [Methylophilaceae bacterium]|nr:lysophospholipid acyltransferase family protein [Methylophilaceae bacterium]